MTYIEVCWDTVFERLRFSNNSIPLKGTLVMRVDYTSTRGSWVWCRPKLPCCIASKRCYFYHMSLDGSFIVFWAFTCGSFREGTRARHSYRVLKMNRIMRQIYVYQMLSCLNYHFILYWTYKNIINHNTKFPFPSSFSAELRGIKVHDPRSDDDGGAEAGAVPLPAHTLLVIQFHHQVLDSGREEQVGKWQGCRVFSHTWGVYRLRLSYLVHYPILSSSFKLGCPQ